VARAIITEMVNTDSEHVYLDLSPIDGEKVKKRFPKIASTCKSYGIDIAKQMIPVAPAAHYIMGGVKTNLNGETNIAGLYACGEVACQGVHGANRLASNSLLDGLVFGARIAEHSATVIRNNLGGTRPDFVSPETPLPKVNAPGDLKEQIRKIMWHQVGIIRNEEGLAEALKWFEENQGFLKYPISRSADAQVANMFILGGLVTRAALKRTESRGGHFREDYPHSRDQYRQVHFDFRK